MGNSYAGQLKTTRFEEVLHNSIEASLRSNNLVPRPIFSQLYLEAEQQLSSLEAGSRGDNEEEEEEEEEGLESSSPLNPYQMHPPPEGCCTTDGFCQAGKDLRLVSISNEPIEVPSGFLLVGAKSPNLPDHLLVCAVDKRFLPDDNGHNALLGFSGNCVGCGKKGFCYFTEFSNHINLKLTTQPKKQKHLKYYLVRNAHGTLMKGPLICWRGSVELRSRQTSSSTCSSSLFQAPESSVPPAAFTSEQVLVANPNVLMGNQLTGTTSDYPLQMSAMSPAVFNGKDSPKHQQLVKNNLSVPTRPSVLGTLTNSGPPKKRHKGWSPESPSALDPCYTQTSAHRMKTDSAGVSCLPQAGLVGPATISSPVVAAGEPVSVPDNLLKICKAKPVIFKGHGNFPYLCGNLSDVIVSSLLYTCYQNSQSISRAYEQYGASTIQPISEEMQLLLTVYYLVQLASDQVPLIEDLEQILMRSWRESHLTEIRQYQQAAPQPFPQVPSHIAPVTSAQLPWLAGLAASSCNDSVHIIECSYSLAEGLSEMFKLLIEGKLVKTNYVVIICACRNTPIDSCIAVTGKYQARILSESLLSPAEYQKEVNYELMTGKVESLGAFFSTLCPEGDIDILLDKFYQENQNHISSSLNTSVNKPAALDASGTPLCTSYGLERHQIRPLQLAVAQKLLSHVCSIADSSTQNLDLGSFEKVDFLICVPPSEVTYQQTLFHLWHSGVLLELGLEKEHVTKQRVEQYVVKLDAEAQTKFKVFLQNSLQNPHTLFVLIHDHAHWDLVSAVHNLYPQTEPAVGLVDRLLNCREVKEAPNIVTLHVTSFPYALQTQHTLISPYNEIHWPASYSNGMDLYQENKKYFGLSEFIESTLSGHSLPLLRYDSSFEAMVMALGKRFPRLHSAVIRTFVLVQHYSAAMMAVSGLSQMKNYTSVETLEITQNLINSSKQCACGHGLMVVLRIPCIPLAAVAYERLYHVRERLALEDHFEIILGNPNSTITIGKHFVEQLKVWQKIEDAEWRPQTYLELEGLPCILIFSGMDPHGESLPRSLRYCDLRLINSSCLMRTTLEQELGLAAYFVSSEVPMEKVTVGEVLESDPEKLSSTDNEDEEIVTEGSVSEKRSPVKRERSCSHDSASSSLSSKTSSLAFCNESSPPLVSLGERARSPHPPLNSVMEEGAASCEKQRQRIGKTGAYLQFLSILSRMLIRLTEVDVYDEEEININLREESGGHYPQHNDVWPDLEIFKKMPFDYIIHDPKYDDASMICSRNQKIKSDDKPAIRKHEDLYVRRQTTRMRLSKYAAYNTYHHCEQCHQYLGFNPRYQLYESTLHAFAFSYSMLGEEIQLHFIIPKSKEHHFVFSQPGGQLESMRLPLVTDKNQEFIKSPTFTPTTGRHEHGLFNLYHAMDGASHLHVLVVKEYEMAIYKKYWPNHIMLVLPSIFNSAGVGAAHFLIKELSYHNLELERNRQEELGIKPQDIWPFIVISDDSCVMWNMVDIDSGGERRSDYTWSERNVSLKHILQHIEAAPNVTHYALIGMRKWSSKTRSGEVQEPFSRCHIHDFIILNVDLTQNVQYNQNRFTCDDVDFNLRVHSAGLLLCRFNRFSVMKKQIAVGGHRSFHIKSKVSDNLVSIAPSQYICAPDSKHTFLAAPAQLLLEKFLQYHSHRFFPLSLKNYGHPVLSVDCYLNLGPQVAVCYVSSRPHSLNISCSDLLFSGLLLYLCDSFVVASFLKKFHFLKGATLCVICQDRNSLRQTVVRLELEDEWQFRLRDEFQTANAKEDRPLFFLTGRHI
ncbi:protein GREB1 isoform X7 [Monodelphis domestica]|uniref:protein GREB1 isoform X7 n=1 Tax=Monodelphis domestica TaxID=13616 RepID=UPI0024E1E2D1|nr:protein GREB1 isoform X7 [Monodelphis domestica]